MIPAVALPLVILGHPPNRSGKCILQGCGYPGRSLLPGGGVELPRLGLEIHPIEFAAILLDCGISPSENGVEDSGNRLSGLGVGASAPGKKRIEGLERWHADTADQPAPSPDCQRATRLWTYGTSRIPSHSGWPDLGRGSGVGQRLLCCRRILPGERPAHPAGRA